MAKVLKGIAVAAGAIALIASGVGALAGGTALGAAALKVAAIAGIAGTSASEPGGVLSKLPPRLSRGAPP